MLGESIARHPRRRSHYTKGQTSTVERRLEATKEQNEDLQVKNFNTARKKIHSPTQQHNLPLLPYPAELTREHGRSASCPPPHWERFSSGMTAALPGCVQGVCVASLSPPGYLRAAFRACSSLDEHPFASGCVLPSCLFRSSASRLHCHRYKLCQAPSSSRCLFCTFRLFCLALLL